MNKIISIACALILASVSLFAQSNSATLNSKADNIIGTYYLSFSGEESKVKITKESAGSYKAQVIWVKNDKDKSGKKRLDEKNPDKSLRTVPCDQIVLIQGLKYNSKDKIWTDAKIYDPTRGIKANVKVQFQEDGKLALKGSLMGISETSIWTKVE